MVWGKAGSTTLTTTGDDITSSVSNSNTYTTMSYHINSGNIGTQIRFNGDTGSNYSKRTSEEGGSDTTATSQSGIFSVSAGSHPMFQIEYICNISSEEKLVIGFNGWGAGTGAPARTEIAGKWANTSDVISSMTHNNTGNGDYNTDSNLSVLGSELTPAATQDVTVTDGSIFNETDTNKEYILYNNTWTEV